MSSGEFWSIGVLATERITMRAYEEYPTMIIMVQSSAVFMVRADMRILALSFDA